MWWMSLIFTFAVNTVELVNCATATNQNTNVCTADQPFDSHQAKQYLYELNRAAENPQRRWQLPTVSQLKEQLSACDADTNKRWWMTVSILQHGDEILVGAFDCVTQKTEFVPVRTPLNVLFVR